MTLSANTLMLTIKAVQRDIEWHRSMANDESLPDDEADEHGQYALDLIRALGELKDAYKGAQQAHPELPTLEKLTGA